MELYIHPRIHAKHPELDEVDERTAFNSMFRHIHRATGECVGIGVDGRQRLVELVFRECDDRIVVYHALTPPTAGVLRALGMSR